jgi:CRISPR-associated protein Csx3
VHYSLLAMSHAILQDMLTPEQAAAHLSLIDKHLTGPDGMRLFDRPFPYRGGPERFFQRAEEATYFGREIGLMYMHAHLRHAQALAHLGDAEGFFRALCQANPIAIRELVPTAALRQSNCYYSSSDAAFDDRYQAAGQYGRIAEGTVALEGGWRVYSSGAAIALALIRQSFLGLVLEPEMLRVDPVMPGTLDGLRLTTTVLGRPVEVRYRVGARGCGVRRITVNGEALTFKERPGLYRTGPALVPRAALLEKLRVQRNEMEIELA